MKDDDPLAPARGCLVAFAVGVVLYGAFSLAWWVLS